MASYYIAAAGSTSNSGTAPAAPWPLSKVSSVSFVAGDHILFQKGDTFSGTINFAHSGSSGNPITFDLYGNAVHNAIIDGGNSGSPVISIGASSFLVFNNLVFQNSNSGNGVFYGTTGCHDLTWFNCYINTGRRGINITHGGSGGVANMLIDNCWFKSISDANFTFGGGNPIQLNNCNGSNMVISNNKIYTPYTHGTNDPNTANQYVGDLISVYQCNGTPSSHVLVHDNQIQGGNAQLYLKAGIVLGDVGGSYQDAYNNIVVNGGSVGIMIQGGTFNSLTHNTIYGEQFPYSGLGISFGNYSGAACNNITISNNAINWRNYNNGLANYAMQTSGSSTASGVSGGPTLATPTGWLTNTANNVADPAAFYAMLANPLWTGTPWDTNTAIDPPIRVSGRVFIQL